MQSGPRPELINVTLAAPGETPSRSHESLRPITVAALNSGGNVKAAQLQNRALSELIWLRFRCGLYFSPCERVGLAKPPFGPSEMFVTQRALSSK